MRHAIPDLPTGISKNVVDVTGARGYPFLPDRVPHEGSMSFQSYLKGIKSAIRETDVGTVRARTETPDAQGTTIVDVREQDEYVQGYIPGATWIPRGFLEMKIEDLVKQKDAPIILYCAGGNRSAL